MRAAALEALRHYLGRAADLARAADDTALDRRPAPGMFTAGAQLATAIGFAGRAVLPLAGRDGPERPEPITRTSLIGYAEAMQSALASLGPTDLAASRVVHRAGFADLDQPAEAYLLSFALPNMIFHLTAAYIALKQAGVPLGKADFDALHAYPTGFSWE